MRRADRRFPHALTVAACLEGHPSLTARDLARRIQDEVATIAECPDDVESGDLRRLLQRAAAWAAATWRDPRGTHPPLIVSRALDALGI